MLFSDDFKSVREICSNGGRFARPATREQLQDDSGSSNMNINQAQSAALRLTRETGIQHYCVQSSTGTWNAVRAGHIDAMRLRVKTLETIAQNATLRQIRELQSSIEVLNGKAGNGAAFKNALLDAATALNVLQSFF